MNTYPFVRFRTASNDAHDISPSFPDKPFELLATQQIDWAERFATHGLHPSSDGLQLLAMASNLIAMVSTLVAMASNLEGMASNS